MKKLFAFIISIAVLTGFAQVGNSRVSEEGLGNEGKHEKKIKSIKERIELENNPSKVLAREIIIILIEHAQELNSSGDFNNAGIHLEEARYYLEKYKVRDFNLESYLYQTFGYNYTWEKDYEKAAESYIMALHLIPDTSILYKGSILRSLADVYHELKERELSSKYYQQALNVLSKGSEEFLEELAKTYQSFGYALLQKGEKKKGEENLFKAYKLLVELYGLSDERTISASNYLGYFYLNENQLLKSIQFFQKSIIGVQEEFSDTSIYTTPNVESLKLNVKLLYALKYKAYALYLLHKKKYNKKALKASISTYQAAIVLVEKAQQNFLNEESLLAFASSYKTSIINYAVRACYEAYQLTKNIEYLELSFDISEKGKASLLSCALLDFEDKNTKGVTSELLEQEAFLKSQISVLKVKIEEEDQLNQKESIEAELFNKMDKLDSIKLSIQEQLKHREIESFDPKPIKIQEIQEQLCKDDLLIEYTLTKQCLYTYTITKDTFKLLKVKIDSSFFKNIKSLRSMIISTDFERNFNDFKKFNDLSYNLYGKLIQPLAPQIVGKRLIIIPEEELLYLPFEVLTGEKWAKGKSYQSIKYLIHDCPISYNYSSTLRFKIGNSASNSNDKFISYAPSYNIDKHGLNTLPYAIKEASFISTLFDNESVIGQGATEHHFKSNAKDYEYIHLAMHAEVDDENPLFSRLYFSGEGDSIDDGQLEINELYQLKINSNLVVLSGCSTGDGELYKGEGLYSMSRGFMQAACPNITFTLWNINDESSYSIISSYYKYLSEGECNDIALQKAKLDFLQQSNQLKALPYFWASYITMGDNNLKVNKESNTYYAFLIIVFFVLLIFIGIYKRRNFIK